MLATPLAKAAWSLVAGAALALGGWVYSIHGRVSAVEAQAATDRAATAQRLQDLRDDVRDLRNALLGPKEGGR